MFDWENKIILITGARGFIGTNLTKYLRQIFPNNIILTPTREELDLVIQEDTKNYFKWFHPDIVFHLAGKVGGIGVNRDLPADFFYENIMMGTNVLHNASVYGCQKVVALAAGCGYPLGLNPPYTEDDFWMGLPQEESIGYSMAKKNLIIQSRVYREQYGLNSSILLPSNLYGPHDNFDLYTSHVVPALIRKFIEAKDKGDEYVEIWGSGKASREFLYVQDAVEAIIDIAERYDETGPLNLGTGQETSIKELVETLSDVLGYEGKIVWNTSKPDGQMRRLYDMTKFKDALGYVPQTSLREGLEKTVRWYLDERK